MNARQRFLETMRYGAPERVPCFEEGLREGVLEAWRAQGLRDANLDEIFHYDRREEIALDLDLRVDLVELARRKDGLQALRRRLKLRDSSRYPEGWPRRVADWAKRQHPLMLQVHEGFFLTLGVGEWRSFAAALYLLADQPEFVRQALQIQGEFGAQLAERVLQRVQIDAAIFSEPIASTYGPLVSPRMYTAFALASYRPILEVLARHGVETIILRTYANARLLLPSIIDAGFNGLWACETNSQAMDYRQMRADFGRDLRLIGGIDTDVLLQDKHAIQRELEEKLPPLLAQGGFIPLADGRVRENVPFENYRYYRFLLENMLGR